MKIEAPKTYAKKEIFMKLLHWIQKQRNRKAGFTLVELIVVLVILAILAALLVPALTGYMDKAKEKQVIAETRSLLTAIQTEASELYAEDKIPQDNPSLQNYPALASKNDVASDGGSYFLTSDELKENYNKIVSLSELKSLENGKGSFICAVDGKGKVRSIIYNAGNGYTGLYFAETAEYMAVKASTSENAGAYDRYINKVIATHYYATNPQLDPWGRTMILFQLGYGNPPEYN